MEVLMANGWNEVKKHSPCPICGTGDFCAWHTSEDGYGVIRLCKRYKDSRVIIPGGDTPGITDGEYYLLIAESGTGYGIYRNAKDVQEAEANGFKVWTKEKRDNFKPKDNVAQAELIPIGINEVASDNVLDKFYRELIKMYPISDEHKRYLKNEGWSDRLIENSNLASFPVEDWRRSFHNKSKVLPKCFLKYRRNAVGEVVKHLGEPVGVPGFYIDTDKRTGEEYWTYSSRSGIVFPVYNENGLIVRLRVRMDYIDAIKECQKDEGGIYFNGEDGKKRYVVFLKGVFRQEFDGKMVQEKDEKYRGKGKYRWVTSFFRQEDRKNGTYSNSLKNGTESGNICGLYAKDTDNFLIAIATEGEKKSIIGNDALGMPFCLIPGVSSSEKLFTSRIGKNILDYLRARGTQYIAVAFDADKYSNMMVLNAEEVLVKQIYNAGFKAIIVTWDVNAGKGLDDALNAGAKLKFNVIEEREISCYYENIRKKL